MARQAPLGIRGQTRTRQEAPLQPAADLAGGWWRLDVVVLQSRRPPGANPLGMDTVQGDLEAPWPAVSMLIGEIFLETMATGIITQDEIDWLTIRQSDFDRDEEAKALKIGRLLDEGQIQIGCRLLGTHRPVVDAAEGSGSQASAA